MYLWFVPNILSLWHTYGSMECMYVCTYVCMYVCIYVRMNVCMYVRMYVLMYVCVYVLMYVRMYLSMYVCMYVRMCIMYVCKLETFQSWYETLASDSPSYLARQKELFSATGPDWRTQLSRNLLITSPDARDRSTFLYPVLICERKIMGKYQRVSQPLSCFEFFQQIGSCAASVDIALQLFGTAHLSHL